MMQQPRTRFEWGIYANATFAGLAVLIPLPLLDLLFEYWFRRHIPTAVARHRDRQLAPGVAQVLNQGYGCSCATLPFLLTFQLLKRLSRKILYFLTVKEAVDLLSYYWHRAFLIDNALLAGHLENPEEAQRAYQALTATLEEIGTSPLNQVAVEVIKQSRHVLRTLLRVVRRGQEDEVIAQDRATMRQAWDDLSGYLSEVAERYHRHYERVSTVEAAEKVSTGNRDE